MLEKIRQSAFVILTVAAVGFIYVWQATAGTFQIFDNRTSYYDSLAQAFLVGQTHLLKSPPPALLAAKNPFNPSLRPLWLWDASLYQQKQRFRAGLTP